MWVIICTTCRNNNICSGPGFPQCRVFTLRSGNQAHLTLCPVPGSDSLLSASWRPAPGNYCHTRFVCHVTEPPEQCPVTHTECISCSWPSSQSRCSPSPSPAARPPSPPSSVIRKRSLSPKFPRSKWRRCNFVRTPTLVPHDVAWFRISRTKRNSF